MWKRAILKECVPCGFAKACLYNPTAKMSALERAKPSDEKVKLLLSATGQGEKHLAVPHNFETFWDY